MSVIAAIEKAQKLRNFAQHCGSPLREFQLSLTKGEAYELLDHMVATGYANTAHREQFNQDVLEAKAAGDPWMVLQHFNLMGLTIERKEALH